MSDLTVTSSGGDVTAITTTANTTLVPSVWYTHECPVPWHTEDALHYDHLRTGCGTCAPGWFLHLPPGAQPSWRRGIWG